MTEFKKTVLNKKLPMLIFTFTFIFMSLFGISNINSKVLGLNIVSADTVTYTTTANLNIRTGPSTTNKIITTVTKGTQLKVTEKATGGWLKISYKGQIGYVSGKYVKVSTDSNSAVSTTAATDDIQVIAQPESIPVLVNKQNKLPENYVPDDLIYTTIPFTFKEKTEKKKMRSEAATAIADLFKGAKKQGVSLLGVSAYRSHATQTSLFNYYVKRDGYDKAITYSAFPGTSEHETGLTIDVTGGDGKCAAEDCFGDTTEAAWLQENVADYGFIIRYPKGKEDITGYKYEPWHLRFVGKEIAQTIMSEGITLEEYYDAKRVATK